MTQKLRILLHFSSTYLERQQRTSWWTVTTEKTYQQSIIRRERRRGGGERAYTVAYFIDRIEKRFNFSFSTFSRGKKKWTDLANICRLEDDKVSVSRRSVSFLRQRLLDVADRKLSVAVWMSILLLFRRWVALPFGSTTSSFVAIRLALGCFPSFMFGFVRELDVINEKVDRAIHTSRYSLLRMP